MKKTRYTEEQIAFGLKPLSSRKKWRQKYGHFGRHFLHLWTTSILQVLNQVLGCYLHLSGIRNICAQIGNQHTIEST